MENEDFKRKISAILQEKVDFLGKKADSIMNSISQDTSDRIFVWLRQVVLREVHPIHPARNQTYKGIPTKELLVFRYAFSIEGTAYRILLVKVRNRYFWEFHLGDHDYYDTVRKKLSVRESSLQAEGCLAVHHCNTQ